MQHDILPIVEGTTVNYQARHGADRSYPLASPPARFTSRNRVGSDYPQLQGRFPIRVELDALGRDDFVRILTDPKGALIKQYMALLQTEGVTLEFTDDAIGQIAGLATTVNENENIGARRTAHRDGASARRRLV